MKHISAGNDFVEMMRYVCLVYGGQTRLHGPNGLQDVECLAYDEALRDNGQLIVGQALASVQSAATIRVRGGRALVAAGPVADTREQLDGFLLIEARDLNEAIRVAARIPAARMGSIEVRPVRRNR